jgi:hypothetical protein
VARQSSNYKIQITISQLAVGSWQWAVNQKKSKIKNQITNHKTWLAKRFALSAKRLL